MRKYLIPISMAVGMFLGSIIGNIMEYSIPISTVLGGGFGIIIGSIAQSIVNEITPDSYFIKKENLKKSVKWDGIEAEVLDDEIEQNSVSSDTSAVPHEDIFRDKLGSYTPNLSGDTVVIGTFNENLNNKTQKINHNINIPNNQSLSRQQSAEKRQNLSPSKRKRVIIEEEDDE